MNNQTRRLTSVTALMATLAATLAAPTCWAAGTVTTSARSVLAASSCQASAVQQALDAAPDNAIVDVPAGNCDWGNTTVSYDQNKSIWLRGAGIGNTIIRRSSAAGDSYALIFDCNEVKQIELSGFTFQGRHSSVMDGGLFLSDSCRDFKIHHMRFDGFTMSGIEVRDKNNSNPPYSRGVIYQSEFENHFNPNSPSTGEGYPVVVYGSHRALPLELGTAEAVYIEDNFFKANRHSIASNYGSRYVVRHNDLVTTDTTRTTSMIDAHGRQPGSDRGSRSWEVYQNHLTFAGDDYQADGISMRGGDGVIWGNLLDFEGDTEIGIAYTARLTIEDGECPSYANPPSGIPGVSHPAPDQTVDAWIWGNTHIWASQPADHDEIRVTNYADEDCRFYFQEGRDYHLSAKPGYTPYTNPHPLRGGDDVIFANAFESTAGISPEFAARRN